MKNRSGIYNDLFFETIAIRDGQISYLDEHVNRINHSLHLLQMEGKVSNSNLRGIIENAIGERDNARVRITFYRDSNGFYLPDSNKFGYDLEVFELPAERNEISDVCIYDSNRRYASTLSGIKNLQSEISVLASLYCKEKSFNDAVLLNQFGRVCEGISSNIFLVKNQTIYTPSLDEGCVSGIIRGRILAQSSKLDLDIKECEITIQQLLESDEVIFTNCIHRIVSVKDIEGRKYENTLAYKLKAILN